MIGTRRNELVINASYSEIHLLFNFSWKCGSCFAIFDSDTLVLGTLLGLGDIVVIKTDIY